MAGLALIVDSDSPGFPEVAGGPAREVAEIFQQGGTWLETSHDCTQVVVSNHAVIAVRWESAGLDLGVLAQSGSVWYLCVAFSKGASKYRDRTDVCVCVRLP